MIAVGITIQSLEDARKGKPIMEGITMEDLAEAKKFQFGILEGGMASGKTSLMFLLKDEDGIVHYAECSGSQFEMLISVFRGAVERFEK